MRDDALTGEVLPPEVAPIRRLDLPYEQGMTIAQILRAAELPLELYEFLHIRLNGVPVLDWEHVFLIEGDTIEFFALPAGGGSSGSGKQLLSSIAMLAITLVAPAIGGWAATGLTGLTANLVKTGVAMGVSLVGALLIRALIPPPSVGGIGAGVTGRASPERPTYFFTGQSNDIRLYQKVPRIYGKIRYVPPLAATPQIINAGKTSRISILYDFGLGNVEISDMKSGALNINVLSPEIRIHRNTATPDLDFIARGVAYDTLDYELVQNAPVYLQTNNDAIGATVDITFPSGLVRFLRNGDRRMNAVGMRIRYRKQGTTAWTVLPATKYAGANKNQQALVFTSHYEVADLAEMEDVTDAWVTRVDGDDGDGSITLVRNGRQIYSQGSDEFDRTQSLDVGGRTYQRGISRLSVTENDGDQRTAYEILEGNPTPASVVTLSNNTGEPFIVSASLSFPTPGVWEIEVVRTTPVTDPLLYQSVRDATRITMIKSWKRGSVLNLSKPHTMVEIRYTATDVVNGVIDNFSAMCQTVLRDFNAAGFVSGGVKTSNNANIAIDLLTGVGSKYPLAASQIDWPSWARLKAICNQSIVTTVNGVTTTGPRFRWNGVLESDMTVREAVQAVLANCRAALTLTTAGKWGVLIDADGLQPRQMITPRNSWAFNGNRPFVQMPDALRVAFVNAEADWAPADTLVFRDGKNLNNTSVIEDVPTTGITSYAEAWRYGRYMMAQAIVRSEQFVVSMDVENLAVQRGDMVLVQHDVPLFGGMAYRVVSVNAGQRSVTLDGPIELSSGRYTVRRNDGVIQSGTVNGQIDSTTIRVSDTTDFTPDALVALDQTTDATEAYLVMGIEPIDDLAAQLTLVRYDPAVYTADAGKLPVWDPGFGQDINQKTNVQIDWVDVRWEWTYADGYPFLRVIIDWRVIAGAATYGGTQVEVSVGSEPWQNVASVPNAETIYTRLIRYDERTWFDGALALKLTPYNSIGQFGPPIRRNVRLPVYNAIPDPPSQFSLDVRSQEVTLFWKPSPSPDVVEYVLRYSPLVEGALWTEAQHLTRVNAGHVSYSTGARTGTYFIAAENRVGNQSISLSARTTIEELPDINVMDVYNPAPTWAGTTVGFTRGKTDAYSYAQVLLLDDTIQQTAVPVGWDDSIALLPSGSRPLLVDIDVPSDTLVSRTDWGEPGDSVNPAVFTYQRTLDLGAVFEVRIQSLIKASAVETGTYTRSDVMATYSNTTSYAADEVSDDSLQDDRNWDCWLEYRAVDQMDVIADWDPLSSIASMAMGGSEFGPWRAIRVGDATGRFFQFRLVAYAESEGVMILVTDGTVEVDMPDRTFRVSNLAVPASGLTVNFNPAFAAPPIIAVTLEGSGQAVRYAATNLTRTAVTIRLYNSAGTAVSGQIDLAALGYGRERTTGV
jgi:hypothetical protein